MFRPINTWPSTPASAGTLFFAQSMKSFLQIDEFEGFRAYTLDTLSRLSEAIAIADDISNGKLAQPVLESAARELAWSLRADRAARAIAPHECSLIVSQCENNVQNYRSLLANMRLLKRRLYPKYRTNLTEQVVSKVNDPKARSDLLSATGFLVSHLINDGHDREFLANSLNRRFFSNDMKRVGAAVVKAFINGIGNERNQYKVFHGIDEVIEQLIDKRSGWKVVARADLDPIMSAEVAMWNDNARYQKFAVKTEFSPDSYRAAVAANDELERLKAFMIIPTKQVRVDWSRECYVRRPRGKLGESLVRYDRPLQKFTAVADGAKWRADQTISLFKKMEGAFDDLSKSRLSRAIATANTATKTTEESARLIATWSAFEILSSDPNETKILHFVKELVPAICITYHRRVFAAVYSSLSLSYKGPFRKLVLDTVGVGQGGSYARFAKLILLLEYANERSTLLNMLSDNPLALNRLFRLEKYYGTPKSFDKSMNEHAKRVSWQLKRIYRVRNSLVHAGEAPEYLESLLGNSLDYFRSCITNFIRVADRDESLADLDSVIAEIGMDWLLMTKRLAEAGNAAFDGETVESLFRPL